MIVLFLGRRSLCKTGLLVNHRLGRRSPFSGRLGCDLRPMMAGVPKRDPLPAAQRPWLVDVHCAQAENVSPGFNTAPKKPPQHLQKPTLNATQLHSVTFSNNTTCFMITPLILPPRAARVTLALQGDKTTHTHLLR